MLYSVSDMFQYFLTQSGTTEYNALLHGQEVLTPFMRNIVKFSLVYCIRIANTGRDQPDLDPNLRKKNTDSIFKELSGSGPIP